MSEKTKGVDQWELIKHYLKPIAHFFEMDGVTEICVDRHDEIKIEKNGELEATDAKFESEAAVERLISQIAVALRQPVHPKTHPRLDGRLPTGTRVNAVLHPTSTRGNIITFRCFPKCTITPQQLVEFETLTKEMLEYLKIAVGCYSNILICGSTGSGKTTLMNVLSCFIGDKDRIVTIEDTHELQIEAYSLVSMEAPHRRKLEADQQDITMSALIANALRQRPSRIFVGEIRFPDAANSFLTALNTGHSGCMSTIHANSCEDALYRLDGLVAAAGNNVPFDFVQQQVRGNIDIVIFQERTPLFGRRVAEVVEVDRQGVKPIFKWDYQQGSHISFIQNSELNNKAVKYGIKTSLFEKR